MASVIITLVLGSVTYVFFCDIRNVQLKKKTKNWDTTNDSVCDGFIAV